MRLDEVVDCVSEALLPAGDDPRAYLGLEHLAQGEPTILGHALASEARSAKHAFIAGDLLVGKLRPSLRKAALAGFEGVCSTDILVLRARPVALPRFLLAALHTERFWRFAEASASGTRMPRTRWISLRRFAFDLPDLDAQAAAVRALDAMDRAVSANAAHLDQLRRARWAMHESLIEAPELQP